MSNLVWCNFIVFRACLRMKVCTVWTITFSSLIDDFVLLWAVLQITLKLQSIELEIMFWFMSICLKKYRCSITRPSLPAFWSSSKDGFLGPKNSTFTQHEAFVVSKKYSTSDASTFFCFLLWKPLVSIGMDLKRFQHLYFKVQISLPSALAH